MNLTTSVMKQQLLDGFCRGLRFAGCDDHVNLEPQGLQSGAPDLEPRHLESGKSLQAVGSDSLQADARCTPVLVIARHRSAPFTGTPPMHWIRVCMHTCRVDHPIKGSSIYAFVTMSDVGESPIAASFPLCCLGLSSVAPTHMTALAGWAGHQVVWEAIGVATRALPLVCRVFASHPFSVLLPPLPCSEPQPAFSSPSA